MDVTRSVLRGVLKFILLGTDQQSEPPPEADPNVVVIHGPTSITGTVGVGKEDEDVYTASGGVGYYSFYLHEGSDPLPEGLVFSTSSLGEGQFDGTGGFSGTPTEAGTFNVQVEAVDDIQVRSAPMSVSVVIS